ncbi:hypothetical protein GCM10023185_06160 [Hymenobacter saemangeumensis]|uniref:DUF1571 domain-containing protein n=1 Tax=Hymenobacter saemangeumensis TaxID=1084522 RepID=A0ABP8I1I6_9BACT
MASLSTRRLCFWLPALLVLLLAATSPAQPPVNLTTEQLIFRLRSAIEGLQTMRCTMRAQERMQGKIIQARNLVKVNFRPLKVYIKKQDGIEVLWVTGQNDGQAWVHLGRFPYLTLSLNPQGTLMRRDQHHVALQAGFGPIAELLRPAGAGGESAFFRSLRYVGDTLLQGRPAHILRSDFPQFRYVSYTAGKNETPGTVAQRFGCGDYRIMERNNLAAEEKIAEGRVLQVPNAYGRRTTVCVDPNTFLPVLVHVVDEQGLYERFEFVDVLANQPIPAAEFTRTFSGYKF